MTTSSVPYADLESGHPIEKDFAFNNNVANAHVSIRLGFLRKVYGILFTQLMVTVICAGVMFQFKEPLMKAMEYGSFAPLLSVLCALGFLIALMFLKYNTPLNYILLLGFTLSESMAVGFVVVTYSASLVIQAVGLTAVATFCLMAYTMLSKRDFSQWGAGLFIGLLLLLLAGPINVPISTLRWTSSKELCVGLVCIILKVGPLFYSPVDVCYEEYACSLTTGFRRFGNTEHDIPA
ncbi:hypothetical protein AHF37_05032 [Paragonimus kellicotti]|nr:hypothetical protein AHF37_05032 [Paragonimus kellicotti]